MIPGLTWRANGQAVVSGPLLELATALDASFVRLAARFGAGDFRFPPLLDATDLGRLDYFESFPHLATFAVALDPEVDDVGAFAAGAAVPAAAGERHVLTPAACYHAYVHLAGSTLASPLALTTRNTCFRREEYYEPLERQWAFDMREIVFVGSDTEVRSLLAEAKEGADQLLAAYGLGGRIQWEHATDPFFQPRTNPAYLLQRLQPVKHEALFDGRLAIASTNIHHEHFGDAFSIRRAGDVASSACLAFGIHRWLAAIIAVHGTDPAGWPQPEPVEVGHA